MSSLPTDNPLLLRRLKAMKELKGQYYIGSWDALRYLRTMDYYNALREDICRTEEIKYRPTVQIIAKIVPVVCAIVNQWLDLLSIQLSTPKSLSLVVEHDIESLAPIRGLNIPIHKNYTKPKKEDHQIYYWEVDVSLLLKAQLSSPQLADLKDVATPKLQEILAKTIIIKSVKYLIFKTTGERVSLQQFVAEPKFRQGNEQEFWNDVALAVEYDQPEEDGWKQEELEQLKSAWRFHNLRQCHKILRCYELRQARSYAAAVIGSRLESLATGMTQAEEDYLFNINPLLKRAERENTLHCIEVERRIALNQVYLVCGNPDNRSPVKLVDKTIDFVARQIKRERERCDKLRELGAPQIILDNEDKVLRHRKYLYIVLRKNRPWLIEFFSR